jgi:hypothetical protein
MEEAHDLEGGGRDKNLVMFSFLNFSYGQNISIYIPKIIILGLPG